MAGIVEAGEEPTEVAKRETREETGMELSELLPITRYFVSPGGTTETVSLFLGKIDSRQAGGVFGLVHEGEDIKVHVLEYETALTWVGNGRVKVATTIIALQWLAMNRAEIRDRWNVGTPAS